MLLESKEKRNKHRFRKIKSVDEKEVMKRKQNTKFPRVKKTTGENSKGDKKENQNINQGPFKGKEKYLKMN